MKVRISDLSQTGLEINQDLPSQTFNERLDSARSKGLKAVNPLQLFVRIIPIADQGAQVSGKVKIIIEQPCARCNENQTRTVAANLDLILKPRPANTTRKDDFEDDIGIAYFTGDYIDIEEIAHEALILALDLYWKPVLNARGACTLCGINYTGDQKPVPSISTATPFSVLKDRLDRSKKN